MKPAQDKAPKNKAAFHLFDSEEDMKPVASPVKTRSVESKLGMTRIQPPPASRSGVVSLAAGTFRLSFAVTKGAASAGAS
eukprot:917588-Rhodomonas_salina.1